MGALQVIPRFDATDQLEEMASQLMVRGGERVGGGGRVVR